MIVSGAAGLVVAALIYFGALGLRGALSGILPNGLAGTIIFFILLVVSILEIGVMVLALRQMLSARLEREFIYALNLIYVAFASVYAAIFLILVGDTSLGVVLAGLSLVRLLSDFWIQ